MNVQEPEGGRGGPFFGLSAMMEADRASRLAGSLRAIWRIQIASMSSESTRSAAEARIDATSVEELQADLDLLSTWFNPIASGKRLRTALAGLQPCSVEHVEADEQLRYDVDNEKVLLTPEGRAVLWVLTRHGMSSGQEPRIRSVVLVALDELDLTASMVTRRYREWALQRLSSVSGLLREETATLRPTAAGLLFMLLVNRNTSWERRLPAPDDRERSAAISAALSAPAIAFARCLTNQDRAQAHGLDLYRGWALGEISRRLGAGLHRADEGIWIAESAVPQALDRLAESLAARPAEMRARVPGALDAALSAYERSRSLLSGMGLAYERPSNTSMLVDRLTEAASRGSAPTEAVS